jgi:hypothetical protein
VKLFERFDPLFTRLLWTESDSSSDNPLLSSPKGLLHRQFRIYEFPVFTDRSNLGSIQGVYRLTAESDVLVPSTYRRILLLR